MGKHTPGPWKVYSEHSDYPGVEASSLSIVVWGDKRDSDECGVQGSTHEEAKANACLIAAAPEMLEALQLVVGSLSFDREDDFNREVLRRINATIKKAAGQ